MSEQGTYHYDSATMTIYEDRDDGTHCELSRRTIFNRLTALTRDLADARATNTELNRRCQLAESAATQNVEACRREGMGLGRMLANYAAETATRDLAAKTEECERLTARVAELEAALNDANDLCRSAYAIGQREEQLQHGSTNWRSFLAKMALSLNRQRAALSGANEQETLGEHTDDCAVRFGAACDCHLGDIRDRTVNHG